MSEIVSESTLIKQRQQGLTILSPLKSSVTALTVKTAQDYEGASTLLSRIKGAKESWLGRINPIIEPIRAGLDLLYGLRKDIVDPLDELELSVKKSMKEFKVEEACQIAAAAEVKAANERELARQAAEKEERESRAKTQQLRDRLAGQRAELEQKLATSQATAAPTPIKVSGSGSRTVRKWRVNPRNPAAMLALLDYIMGYKAEDLTALVSIDSTQMDAYFKLCKPDVGEWLPGIEVYDDINITGRRG